MKRLPDAWYVALTWLFFASLGLIFPVGVGLLVVAAISKVTLENFTDGGQFAMYTAAMLSGTVYLVAKPGTIRLPWTEWFLWFALPALFLSATFFTLATLLSSGQDIDPLYFRWPSVALAVFSLAVAFIAVGLDNRRLELNIEEQRRKELGSLQRDFDRALGDEEH